MTTTPLERWFLAGLPGDARAWLEQALAAVRAGGPSGDALIVPWSGAGRRLGRTRVEIDDNEARALAGEGAPFVPRGWGTDELGRALLLLAAAQGQPPAVVAAAVDDLYHKGEMREQQAVLRVLAYLPEPAGYAALAADAVRSNVISALEALACDNPFPAAHMNELAFNHLVMKSIFNGLPLARIVGLRGRAGAELVKMAQGLAAERRAAGRPVPDDLDLILRGAPDAAV